MPHLLNQNCQDTPSDTKSDDINQLSSSSPPPPPPLPPLATQHGLQHGLQHDLQNSIQNGIQTTAESSSSSSSVAGATKSAHGSDDDDDKSTTTTITPHSSPHKSLTPSTPSDQQHQQQQQPNDNTSTHSSNADDCDEIKVYNEEGAEEDEQRSLDNLKEEKSEIIEAKPSVSMSSSHPFSVNNLMLFNTNQSDSSTTNSQQSSLNPFLLGYRSPLYNPLYSPELASHFASWWPAAAAASALYNPTTNPFSAFAYQQQQFAAAAALSRFNPSLFLNAAAAAAAANNNNNNNNIKSEPGSTNPHNMASSSSSSSTSSSSSASPFSSSSTTSSSTSHHKPYQPLQNSKQFNHMTNKTKHEINSPRQHHNHNQNSHHQHQHQQQQQQQQQQQHYMNQHNMLMSQAAMHRLGGEGSSISEAAAAAAASAPPPPHIQLPSKSKKPHIKKPLNAFMLFMKEQRAKVVNECTLRESAAINQILGRKWHELERGEQAKYYEMARQERLKHMQLYPGWSARDNYGLKKKRRRKREKVIGENGELPRKCRARFGLQQINLWCKPCRRKKKCIRYANNENADASSNCMNSTVSPMIMGPNGHMYPNPMYNAMMMSGDSAAGSVNGANSEDEYEDDLDEMGDELLPGGQEDETDDDDDDETDSEDDENELDTTKDLAHNGFTSSPIYHPNKKANLDTGSHPLSQIQQQFHQQFQQSMDSSKHNLMHHIQQMHHQFQNGHAAINALNYSSMFNGVPLNEPAHTAAPN